MCDLRKQYKYNYDIYTQHILQSNPNTSTNPTQPTNPTKMPKSFLPKLILACILQISIISIGIPLHNGTRCMIIEGQFDPIKLEVTFPQIPNKQEGDKFRITLVDYLEAQRIFQIDVEEKVIYRKNLQLSYNKIFQLCMQFVSDRRLNIQTQKIYAQFKADQDFQSLIGKFAVPAQLLGQKNLQYIYNISSSISQINKKVLQNQKKEREIEDGMAISNLHKNERISMFTVLECVIIVLSGVYQVFALRRFLIEKNLY